MAQNNSPNAEKKQSRRKKAEKPYVEQIDELLLVHNKSDPKERLGVISEVDENGNYKAVQPKEENEKDFLKFDKNSSILENFLQNFWKQLKNPTHFQLIRLTINDYKRNRQAIKDLAEGKKTDAVKEFLKNYEIVPKANNQKEEEKTTMAKKQEQTSQIPEQVSQVEAAATGQEQQNPQPQQQKPMYRYDENMINWEELSRVGISKEMLEQSGQLDGMLKGYKTNKTMPLTLNIPGVLTAKLDARLSLMSHEGMVLLGIHGIRKEPELDRPYFGHIFTEEDKKNLRENGNMGRVAELNLRGRTEPCLISIDKNTNELVAVRQENVYIPEEIKGVKLTPDEIQKLKNGEKIFVDGMTSANGKEFNSHIQYNAERRGIEFLFDKEQGFRRNELGGVKLTPMQIQALNEGHTILVEDMKRKDGTFFSSFVTMDKVTNDLRYTRHNPETGEIYIPKEISSVQLTPEDKEALRKGQPIFLENMINKKGEEFSSFVRLDMVSGRPQYSRTPDGFSERAAPTIQAELYGHLLTAKEKATLQDGKALLLSDLKGPNGQSFSAYAKINPNSGQIQYFQENPDIRRDTSRRVSQTENSSKQQEQKQGSKQAV
ncbi:DUF3945 domain-containing protein [Phocaeicola plebeius]|uniref:DUF3945 domain-containing protein n=1 Tax=Phocaeicola plebeius TaxID=310297 RepID=UPI0026ED8236|nr:DUF3945 domain-containing protein [Phocaeicola plebeius]